MEKLCKDCTFCRQKWFMSAEFATCAHPSVVSPVNGAAVLFCSVARMVGDTCGPQAKDFQPKE